MNGLTVSALGVRIRLRFHEDAPAAVRKTVAQAWADATLPHDTGYDVSLHVPQQDHDKALENLSSLVTYQALRFHRGKKHLFHAAGVADSAGRVVAFVGPSGAGKTSLSRVLGRHHGYVSDETVAVDDDLSVLPYRKPLSLVREGSPKQQVAPSALGLKNLPEAPLQLDRIVLLDRQETFEGYELEPVPLVEAITFLLQQMSFTKEFSVASSSVVYGISGDRLPKEG